MELKYYMVRRQNNGCDYTIGCGISISELKASSMAEAIENAIDLDPNWKEKAKSAFASDYIDDMIADSALGYLSRENPIVKAEILAVVESVDLIPIIVAKLQEIDAFKDALLKETQEEKERDQYKRLKKKFEGK
ncbi:MAG TPA: hypothetical protein VI423_08115 [Paenisporosarcina sp.]|nr:hypothetical protein [Paenisporosarcina sp.]